MSTRELLLVTALCLVVSIPTRAQGSPANPVVASAQEIYERQSKYIAGAADEMPADKYSYHPTPEQWTFAQIVSHVAQSDFAVCSILSDTPAPQNWKVTVTDPKEKLVPAGDGVVRVLLESTGGLTGFETGRHGKIFPRPPSAASESSDRTD